MSHSTSEIKGWIDQARWFGGKGRDWELGDVRRVGRLPDAPEGLHVTIELAEVAYADGSSDLYQLPLAFYAEPQERIAHALIGEWEDKGREKGRSEGRAAEARLLLHRVLAARSFPVTPDVRARIDSEPDVTRLESWLEAAVTATSIGDVFRLQDELSQRIVAELSPSLALRENAPRRGVPASARAYEFYLRANEVGRDWAHAPVARDLYRQCVDADPAFAPPPGAFSPRFVEFFRTEAGAGPSG